MASATLGEWTIPRSVLAAARDLAPRGDANALLTALPVQAMARLLGVADADLDRTVGWVHEFTAGMLRDPVVHNTRRFAAEEIALGARRIAAGLRALAPVGEWFGPVRGYRPLPNARVPIFAA